MTLFSNFAALFVFLGLLNGAHGAAVQLRASSGCGRKHDWAGQTKEFSFESSGGTRHYRIHLPSNYDTKTAKPLLIAYHGKGNNPKKFEGETRFSEKSVNPNMIVVYPQGVNGVWQGPKYPESNPKISDKVFTSALVQRIKDNYCVDESRVYATGHSNGAGFAGTLACSPEHGGQFAAFAPISGAFYTDVKGNDNCHPARSPLPMFEVHGTGDKRIPYEPTEDGNGGPLPSIPDWVSRWAKRNKCDAPKPNDLGNGVHDYRYKCQGVAEGLEHIKVDGMGHGWPKPGSQLADVSTKVIEFLNKHRKP
ncbi:hypothetical protein QQS21_006437 [Conoideocrella luteorostrata]|uniref:feruloyl esterase n=1 Tax=Conoideocrella luteorostrata TaxID=1105319 RepID=A0AAJ0CNF8_9HYPO|nr:hypothetical protein QQS21_006437 [Conoideocrella luteorostrata]